MKFLLPLVLVVFVHGTTGSRDMDIITIGGDRYVSLYDLTGRLGAEHSYDIYLGRGTLYYRNHVAVYTTGYSCMLIDGRLQKDTIPVLRRDGDVLLPLSLAQSTIDSFLEDREAIVRGNTLILQELRGSAIKRDSDKIPEKRDRITFIIIDPGHGGKDPGAIGRGGIKEKHITLSISRYLAASLKKRLKGISIHLSRNNDRFIELSQRADIGNNKLKKNTNGIFISVHVNASLSTRISGFETYFLSQNPTNEEARNTAALENNVIVLEDEALRKKKYGDIEYIEARMITTQIQKESSMLAASVQKGLDGKIKLFKSRGVRKADFYVLRGSLMPAVLVEVGFITNTREAQYLLKNDYQQDIAQGIALGVVQFIQQYNAMIK
ncbi:MAG: hypothetical protein CVV44_18315 [Spirochaetae bacterium HGW-Spirochaetae-1]|jgi:N-acetylmuramoyl-L-alanine amidase|nr:MAG: hypothetical protein CVV44_18315 [Spirochaetae bacterium HGW-Spirochaetae-1]